MFKNLVLQNSFWAIFSNIFQNIIFSIFFIVLARVYKQDVFSSYIIANTLYGLLLSFSSLGMAQWFIRADNGEGNIEIAQLFFTIQLLSGFVFYLLNIFLSYLLYDEQSIHVLSIILGFNIVYDNLLYVYKTVNIANFQQKQTFFILSLEAILKLLLAVFVYFVVPSIVVVSIILSLFRLASLLFFIHHNRVRLPFNPFKITLLISIRDILSTIYTNRYFLFIGTISVLFWSIGGILVSKLLSLEDVAHYEISYKLFSMAEVVPLMVLNTFFPVLVKRINESTVEYVHFFKLLSLGNILYGLMAYTFVFSFSGELIPLLFGNEYHETNIYCTEMFLTMTIFPSVLYQANLLIALKQERIDMYLNLLSLLINISIASIGMFLNQSLSSVTYSIFIAFFVFHISQEYFLIKKGVSHLRDAVLSYSILFGGIIIYPLLSRYISVYFLYPLIWIVVFISIIPTLKKSLAKA
jgi:O-antigen/teichoic acid export membrane protein